MRCSIRVTLAVALLPLLAAASVASPSKTSEHAAWLVGIPVELTLHSGKRRAERSARIYLTAPTFGDAAFAATAIQVEGEHRVIPAHDAVVDRFAAAPTPMPAASFFIIPGARATPDTVRSVAGPPNSIPAQPLAREIFVGTDWVRLNSHVIIEYGVAMGWLALEPYEHDGAISTRFLDKPARFSVNVSIERDQSSPSR